MLAVRAVASRTKRGTGSSTSAGTNTSASSAMAVRARSGVRTRTRRTGALRARVVKSPMRTRHTRAVSSRRSVGASGLTRSTLRVAATQHTSAVVLSIGANLLALTSAKVLGVGTSRLAELLGVLDSLLALLLAVGRSILGMAGSIAA